VVYWLLSKSVEWGEQDMLGTPSTSPSRLPRHWARERKDSDDLDDEQRESLLSASGGGGVSGVLQDDEDPLPEEGGGLCVQMMRMGGCITGKARTSDLEPGAPGERSSRGGQKADGFDKLSSSYGAPNTWGSKTNSTSTVASSFASSREASLFSPHPYPADPPGAAAAAAVNLDMLPPPTEEGSCGHSDSSSHNAATTPERRKPGSGSSRVSFKGDADVTYGVDVEEEEDEYDYRDDESGFSSNALTVAWQKRQNKASTYRETFGRDTEDSLMFGQQQQQQQHIHSEVDDFHQGRDSVMTDVSEEVWLIAAR
jgi:hypothetical protein